MRNALLDRACYLDTLHMDEAALASFHDRLRRRPPSLLFGHAHSLYLFAEYVAAHGGAGFRPRGILAAAGRTAVTDEPAPPDAEKPHGERQRLVELAPGSRALQVDCCAHGARMASLIP